MNLLEHQVEPPTIILIDDCEIIRLAWKLDLARQGAVLASFSTLNGFYSESIKFPKYTPIYVDLNLNTDKNGLEVARILWEQGFTKITLTTGTPTAQISVPKFLTAVIDKSPPKLVSLGKL